MICDNCNRCPYSQIIENGMIELDRKPSTIGHCELGVPIECTQGKLPRELKELEDNNNE